MEIEAEERRELKRLAAEESAREAEERREIQRLAAEKEARETEMMRLELESEKTDKDRELEWERTRYAVSTPGVIGGTGGKHSIERTLVQSLQLVPEFHKAKVAEWFVRFERKAREFA
ncbi:hypothetical protein E2C01_098764 [Portunus trituberculatus]|uniref:Uncharacterized protein n=1 Tax=Portunus trituberculatus TaxID=210409 RepID=A0A5B7K221_PORTR|nr:hypothetical protein [Portunus trituberculatus]